MSVTHARLRPVRRRAVRAFVLTFWITAVMLAGVWAGLVADVRTRRVCDGDRADGIYTNLAEAIRPDLPPDPEPTAPTESTGETFVPYPIRLLWALIEATVPPASHPGAVAVMAQSR